MLGPIAFLFAALGIPAAEPGPRPRDVHFDRNGDPLPPGAVTRLGLAPPLTVGASDVAWASDGRWFLVAGGASVLTFDASTGRPVDAWASAFDSHGIPLCLSRDGRFLFRPDGDRWILTDAGSGEPVVTYRWPPQLRENNSIGSVGLSANGRFVTGLTGPRDKPGTPWRYDLATGAYLKIADRADVTSLALSSDGRRAFGTTGPDKHLLIAWDLTAGRELWTLALGDHPTVRSVSPDGRRVAVSERGKLGARGREPGQVRVFETAGGTKVRALSYEQPQSDGHRMVDFSPDGRLLAVREWDGVAVLDLDSGGVRHRLPHAAWRVAFAPDGKSLLTASWWVQRWDVETGRPAFPAPVLDRQAAPALLRWSGDGTRLLTVWPGDETWRSPLEQPGYQGGSVHGPPKHPRPSVLAVWDVVRMEPLSRQTCRPLVVDTVLDRTGTTVRAVADDGTLRTWSVLAPAESVVELPKPSPTRGVWLPNFLPDGRLLIRETVARGIRIRVFDPTGKAISDDTIPSPKRTAGQPADGRLHAHTVLAQDGQRTDPITGRPIPPLVASSPIRQVIGFPVPTDGPFVAGRVQVDRDTESLLWESATGRPIAPLPPLLPDWNVAAVSPDGRRLASADGSFVVLIDLRDNKSHRLPVAGTKGIAFSPDGRLVATALADSTIIVWAVPIADRREWKPVDADRLWGDLAAADARPAWLALWHLLDHPDRATDLLGAHLKPVPAWTDTRELIARLDHSRYAVREEAGRELTHRGPIVEDDLRAARTTTTSAEQRERLDGLLRQLTPAVPPDGEVLRGLRTMWLLERLGTDVAKRLLERVAGGEPGALVTREAKAALGRLK
jgi:WD40 repeat protein